MKPSAPAYCSNRFLGRWQLWIYKGVMMKPRDWWRHIHINNTQYACCVASGPWVLSAYAHSLACRKRLQKKVKTDRPYSSQGLGSASNLSFKGFGLWATQRNYRKPGYQATDWRTQAVLKSEARKAVTWSPALLLQPATLTASSSTHATDYLRPLRKPFRPKMEPSRPLPS